MRRDPANATEIDLIPSMPAGQRPSSWLRTMAVAIH
jgi:hypothetical protein